MVAVEELKKKSWVHFFVNTNYDVYPIKSKLVLL